MKKLTVLLSVLLIYLLSPTISSAQEARLVAVRVVGGTCGAIIFVEVDYFTPGGTANITTSISSGLGSSTLVRSVTAGGPTSGTRSFPLDSNGLLLAGAYFRVIVNYAGQTHQYIFACSNFQFAADGITPRTDNFTGIARNETHELRVAANDSSQLPITTVSITQAPTLGTATVADDLLTVIYTAGTSLGRDVFRYEVCNIKRFTNPTLNCGTALVIVTITNLPPDCNAVSQDAVYNWPANQLSAPFVGIGGVTDPDGDPITVAIDSLTSNSGSGAIVYTVEFTATDNPPFPGTPLSCSGSTLVQKDS